jgi:hypothetical protein
MAATASGQPLGVTLLPLAMLAIALPILVGRHRRIRRDGALIYSELDLVNLEARSRRVPPARRTLGAGGAGEGFAQLESRDPFVADALRRAADLAHLLPAEAVARLAGTIEALCKQQSAPAEARRSLIARCILETDPEQKARFDFLALEGQLESMAALSWAERQAGARA